MALLSLLHGMFIDFKICFEMELFIKDKKIKFTLEQAMKSRCIALLLLKPRR